MRRSPSLPQTTVFEQIRTGLLRRRRLKGGGGGVGGAELTVHEAFILGACRPFLLPSLRLSPLLSTPAATPTPAGQSKRCTCTTPALGTLFSGGCSCVVVSKPRLLCAPNPTRPLQGRLRKPARAWPCIRSSAPKSCCRREELCAARPPCAVIQFAHAAAPQPRQCRGASLTWRLFCAAERPI